MWLKNTVEHRLKFNKDTRNKQTKVNLKPNWQKYNTQTNMILETNPIVIAMMNENVDK